MLNPPSANQGCQQSMVGGMGNDRQWKGIPKIIFVLVGFFICLFSHLKYLQGLHKSPWKSRKPRPQLFGRWELDIVSHSLMRSKFSNIFYGNDYCSNVSAA